MTYAAFGIHRRLVEEEGFDASSDDYYSELDKRLRADFPNKFEAPEKRSRPESPLLIHLLLVHRKRGAGLSSLQIHR